MPVINQILQTAAQVVSGDPTDSRIVIQCNPVEKENGGATTKKTGSKCCYEAAGQDRNN